MAVQLEIERKFLVGYPDIEQLDIWRKIAIIQTYLRSGENGSQRRVRRICENGAESYTYTEKVFIDPLTREENEFEITKSEYEKLLLQKNEELVPVEKVRYCFEYESQLFELDTYPFSKELAIMELELDSPDQKIKLPDNVRVIKDVSEDKRYSNASLASAGAFPAE